MENTRPPRTISLKSIHRSKDENSDKEINDTDLFEVKFHLEDLSIKFDVTIPLTSGYIDELDIVSKARHVLHIVLSGLAKDSEKWKQFDED